MPKKAKMHSCECILVGGDGFEPSKRDATDLQSAPFGHSGTPPHSQLINIQVTNNGAGDGTRTPDLLITNQLLYQLSYTSVSSANASQAILCSVL